MVQQILLRNLQQPREADLDNDIAWMSESFGFSAGRDIDRSSMRILQVLLRDIARYGSTSSETLAEALQFSVQRVNYHLRSLVDAGFLFREKKHIFIRQGSVKAAVEELRRDANRIFDNLSRIAEEIDGALGLKNR